MSAVSVTVTISVYISAQHAEHDEKSPGVEHTGELKESVPYHWPRIGAGIGEHFEADKCRYHKVILLCDADVDGSHIRTLLLTFFFRHMPQLIELGHIYIAQPPLFLVKKGSRERYVLTEEEMESELMNLGLDGAVLRVIGKDGAEDRVLGKGDLAAVVDIVSKLDQKETQVRRSGMPLADFLTKATGDDATLPHYRVDYGGEVLFFADAEAFDAWRLEAEASVERALKVCEDDATAEDRAESDIVLTELYGAEEVSRLLVRLREFGFTGADFDFASDVTPSDAEEDWPFQVEANKDEHRVLRLRDVPESVRNIGKKGIHVQRYKGLGEMNPEQLWETTMDPDKRTLLRVKLDDMAATDQVFTILMGTEVEPRRQFIEANALAVKQLDV